MPIKVPDERRARRPLQGSAQGSDRPRHLTWSRPRDGQAQRLRQGHAAYIDFDVRNHQQGIVPHFPVGLLGG